MLLSQLSRKEKLKFLDLAMHVVSVDGMPNALEQRLLNMMLAEVGDGIVKEYTFKLSDNLEETITFFKDLNKTVKHIVYLNLLIVIMTDEFYNVMEHDLLEEIKRAFDIKDIKKKQLMRLVYQERDLRERVKRVVSS